MPGWPSACSASDHTLPRSGRTSVTLYGPAASGPAGRAGRRRTPTIATQIATMSHSFHAVVV
jgi:hypothetical protein